MIAMVARLGPGRDAETKKAFIDEILDAAEAHTMGESDASTSPGRWRCRKSTPSSGSTATMSPLRCEIEEITDGGLRHHL